MAYYIHQKKNWTDFEWDSNTFIDLLSEVRHLQGKLVGRMQFLGFDLQNEALLETLTLDVVKSSEIEGEILNPEDVRSSIAQRLGLEYAGVVVSDRNVEGMVEVMIDATDNCFEILSKERLFDWHAALFPTGRSGIMKIVVGDWRKDISGPMQVVSGRFGKEKIHFQAPDAKLVDNEMRLFLEWFNTPQSSDMVLKAALAHFWFITIHPFQDGNGRIARALTDMLLAKADKMNQRFYSMSAQIRKERKQYYEVLEKTQKGDLGMNDWIQWFLTCLMNALKASEETLNKILLKANFWKKHSRTTLNERQRTLLNKLLEGFEGKLNSSKWAKIAKCSKDSAIRDINDLIQKGILKKEMAGGRSTSYVLENS